MKSRFLLAFALLFSAHAFAQEDIDIPDATGTEEAAAKAEDAVAAASPERDPAAMDPAPADASLAPVYKQFGEEAGLTALMDLFMTKLVADPRTRRFFENSDQV